MVSVDRSENPFIEENSFYYLSEDDELTEFATESLPQNRSRGLETCRRSKLFEQLKSYAESKKSD